MSTNHPQPVSHDYVKGVLLPPRESDDKYTRGVVSMVTGSTEYPGAAVLGVGAAVATGVGMVRYLGPQQARDLVLSSHPEVVVREGHSHALVAGSGFPPLTEDQCRQRLGAALDGPQLFVVDAGAMPHRHLFPGPAILTPHPRELARLADQWGAPEGTANEQAAWVASHRGATVVLKRHDTVVASPDGSLSTLPPAPTWLATAGTGDVLAGIMGAVAAIVIARNTTQPVDDRLGRDIAITSCLIHQEAARLASASSVGAWGKPISASTLVSAVADAVSGLIGPPSES